MKNKYFRYVLLFLVGILLVSCKKNEKIEVKGREYITESGFSFEITQETKVIETTTEAFDIKKHPEMWSMLDKGTCLLVFNRIFHAYSFDFYINKTKMPISQHFLDNYNISSYGLGLINSIEHDDIVEMPHSIEMTDEEFEKKEFRFYSGSPGFISRESKFKFLLDVNNKLDEIVLLKTDVKDYYAESIAESIANRPKSYDDLERYKEVIPDICLAPVYYYRDIDYEPEQVEKKYKNYEGCTENFINIFDVKNGIIHFTDMDNPFNRNIDFAKYVYDIEYNNEYTDLSNNIVGIKAHIYDSIQDKESFRSYKVYFEVDDRNFLDAITKVEEVLEDGTVVEVENNFGK